ncbi:mitochondrial import inner membrane translocase subunit TIM50-C-like [Sitodiplosis mosellana]|uniref:mitochondrial import inner membrane translocase subunit TIM50-C-like n=1 Tax=Sitodiplosis mosellana TaxID=263140 RepID=UPI0024445989|nr:mitochondrial import inner membrane translocase subunit TIM50-C-like [Sitodiplosis mosellana]
MSLRCCSSFLARLKNLPQIRKCYYGSQHILHNKLQQNITSNSFIYRHFCNPASKDLENGTKKPTQILSTLFPQTSPAVDAEQEAQEQKKKQEQDEKKEQEKSWKRMKLGFYVFGVSTIVAAGWVVVDLGAPERDADGQIIEDEFSILPLPKQYLKRMWKSLTYYQKIIQEPSREKLLPDPLKPPYYQPKYTLVLEMKDVLVHPDWTYKTGWRFKKRPGVDAFLEQLAGDYEIVVYTADQGMTVFPILDALDPKGYIMYRLVRDATHFVDGHHVKNLDNLNRDLRKVIVIDWDPNATKLHPENTFHVDRWTGNDDDLTLLDLVSFLKTVSSADVDDVRDVLQYYKQFNSPLAKFKENQQILLHQMQEKALEEKNAPPSAVKRWTPSFLSRK